jgi:CRISPR-associated protein Cmr6
VLGPLGAVAAVDVHRRLGGLDGGLESTNPLLVLRRCAIPKVRRGVGPDLADGLDDEPVRRWAVENQLGQRGPAAADLMAAVTARRAAAALSLHRAGAHARPTNPADGRTGRAERAEQVARVAVVGLRLRPTGPLLIGTGDGGVRDVGISLHGTYGWPTLPGSALKGVAHAYARDEEGMPADRLAELFGSPRPGHPADARTGSVTFLDAVPVDGGVTVTADVMTPHVGPYYAKGKPPAEYWSPVPVGYLSVSGGTWLALLAGPPDAAMTAARLLGRAAADLGFGAKTSAGYGYFTVIGVVREPQLVALSEPGR